MSTVLENYRQRGANWEKYTDGLTPWQRWAKRNAKRASKQTRDSWRRWLERHPGEERAKGRRYDNKARETRVALVARLKSKPCLDCTVAYPSYVMQFDHRDPATKRFGISAYSHRRGCPVEELLAEVEKCDVVCANCHAERTHQRRRAA